MSTIDTFKQILKESMASFNADDFKDFYKKDSDQQQAILDGYGLKIDWHRQGWAIYNEADGINNGFYLARDRAPGGRLEAFKLEGLGKHKGENFSSKRGAYDSSSDFDKAIAEIVKILKDDNAPETSALESAFHYEFESLIYDFASKMGVDPSKDTLPYGDEFNDLETQVFNFIRRSVKNVQRG